MVEKLHFYVIAIDTNSKELKYVDIFRDGGIPEQVESVIRHYIYDESYDLKNALRNIFWSQYAFRHQYEAIVSPLDKSKETRIDVFSQIEPNLETIVQYIKMMANEHGLD